jgi:hypothetical protein
MLWIILAGRSNGTLCVVQRLDPSNKGSIIVNNLQTGREQSCLVEDVRIISDEDSKMMKYETFDDDKSGVEGDEGGKRTLISTSEDVPLKKHNYLLIQVEVKKTKTHPHLSLHLKMVALRRKLPK